MEIPSSGMEDLFQWPSLSLSSRLLTAFGSGVPLFSWSVLFQGFLKLGPLDSLLNFLTFASCPSYSDFSRSGRSCDFEPCPLFLLSFLEILCTPMASTDIPMWTFPPAQHQIGISKGGLFAYLVVSSVPQIPSSIILHPTSIPVLLPASWFLWTTLFLFILVGKLWSFDKSFFFFSLCTPKPAWQFPSISDSSFAFWPSFQHWLTSCLTSNP